MTSRSWIRKLFARNPRTNRENLVGFRPCLETLEVRTLPATSAPTASALIAAIQNANKTGGDTIALSPGVSYDFTSADNSTNGANALPVITSNITIIGFGNTIDRSTAPSVLPFRLFDVAGGGSLTLGDVTLTGGVAQGTGVAAQGGAIYSAGKLNLTGVTVKSNTAQGSIGASAYGGGLYAAAGSVTLSNDTLSGNNALGGGPRQQQQRLPCPRRQRQRGWKRLWRRPVCGGRQRHLDQRYSQRQ